MQAAAAPCCPRRYLQLLVLLACTIARAAPAPVPVLNEPRHKVVFENEWVRILDVNIPSGDTTLYHVHVVPSVIVDLTKSSIRQQGFGDSTFTTRESVPGTVRYAPYDQKALMHRVSNVGAGIFHVMDIELLRPAAKRDPSPIAAGPHLKLQGDEARVRLYSVQLPAGKHVAFSASSCAHLLVNISGRVIAAGDNAVVTTREMTAGEFAFFPAKTGVQLTNPATANAETVVLELK
jgi:hypothetical protein